MSHAGDLDEEIWDKINELGLDDDKAQQYYDLHVERQRLEDKTYISQIEIDKYTKQLLTIEQDLKVLETPDLSRWADLGHRIHDPRDEISIMSKATSDGDVRIEIDTHDSYGQPNTEGVYVALNVLAEVLRRNGYSVKKKQNDD